MTLHVRIILATTLAALAMAAAFPAVAQTPQAVLSVGSGSGHPGQSGVDVTVSLASQGGAQVAGLNFDLSFDSSRVSVASVRIGSAAAAAEKTLSWSGPTSNPIRVMIFGVNLKVIGDGPVAVVTFDVLAQATPGTFALALSNAAATDPAGNKVDVTTTDGSFTVPAPTATPTSTVTPTRTATSTTGPTSTPTATRTRTPTATVTRTPAPGGPTATPGPSPTPTRTPTTPPTPTRTPTTAPTRTHAPGLLATATHLPIATQQPTASLTALAPGETTAAPPLETPTPMGAYPGELETAVAATATALALLDQAVIATATALALEPRPPTTGRLPLGGLVLLLGVFALGALGLGGLLALWLWRWR